MLHFYKQREKNNQVAIRYNSLRAWQCIQLNFAVFFCEIFVWRTQKLTFAAMFVHVYSPYDNPMNFPELKRNFYAHAEL